MDVGAIDRSATRGGGPLREASPISKLTMLGILLAAVLVSWNVLVLATVFICLTAALVWGRVNLRLALSLALYPSLFALMFAFASAPDVTVGAAIVAKAVTAALSAVTVVLSTPYPQIFAPLQRVTPGIVGDALLMTYRSMFILLEKFGDLLRAARLRAGLRGRHPLRAARLTAAALGGLLLYAIDLSQRDYDIMRVRGYAGRLRVTPQRHTDRTKGAILIAGACLLLALSLLWRFRAAALNPYSWIAPIPALLLLGASVLIRREPS